jgi:[acyl-carrier-protein] S-malonyltransferase
MGRGLVETAPEVFRTASDVLGVDVVELCTDGTSGAADLSSTRWAQPAVLVCSVAAFQTLHDRDGSFAAAAGHSVGEYAALVASGAIGLTDALRLVSERADATDEAGRAVPGGMAAVMRIDRDQLARICADEGVALAADNGPGQFVISGPMEDLERAIAAADAAGAKCRRVDVSAAFHSPVMEPAGVRLATALDDVTLSEPRIDLWSSTTAGPVGRPDEIKRALIDQLTSPVRWTETVTRLSERHGKEFCDLGPGRVVAGLTRRIVEGAEIRTTEDLLVSSGGAP